MDLVGAADEAHVHAGLGGQRLEVVEVRDQRQSHDGDVDRAGHTPTGSVVQVQRVLGGHEPRFEARDDAEHRHARARAQLGEPRGEHGLVATESIDDEAADPGAVGRVEQRKRSQERGEHAAAIDVAHEQHRRLGHAGHAHVDNVAVAQVDLGRAPRALDDHEVPGASKTRETLGHDREKLRLHPLILVPGDARDRPSAYHHLRPVPGLGLQEDRVHVHGRLDARGVGLRGLRPTDLAAPERDRRVEGHVLGLERRDSIAGPREDATEGRGEQALADTRCGALHHEARRRRAHRPNRTLSPARKA